MEFNEHSPMTVSARLTTTLSTFVAAAGAALVIGLAPHALAGDVDAGKEKSATCVACHGQNGISISPEFPNLAGQYADYLAHSLRGYKSGERKNVVMAGFAAGLSEEDIEDLAAYYASLEGLRVLGKPE